MAWGLMEAGAARDQESVSPAYLLSLSLWSVFSAPLALSFVPSLYCASLWLLSSLVIWVQDMQVSVSWEGEGTQKRTLPI